jgi:hypothetical protein
VFAVGLDGPKPSLAESYDKTVKFAEKMRENPGETALEAAKTVGGELEAQVNKWVKPASDAVVKEWDKIIDNPSEKYAVLVVGYDEDHSWLKLSDSSDMFYADAAKVYDDLLKVGFKPEHIKVLTPDGEFHPKNGKYANLSKAFADKSYNHHASEANLKTLLDNASKTVDRNDLFTLYVASHGLNDGKDSYVGLQNGKEDLYDYELKEYSKNINGGKELYVVGSCHSGGFAEKLGQNGDIAVSACKSNQPAITDVYGNSLTAYLYDELGKQGISQDTTENDVKAALKRAVQRFKEDHGDALLYAKEVREQQPIVGARGTAYAVGG